ncbi:MAG TPA: transcription termination factor Rho [Gemmataceae bacterium]|jgi:transcription termination factor Rho|nr:transcription termination factor Rho [Gemmataceae bacterium]
MAVARSDDGSSNVAGNLTRRRLIRKPVEVSTGGGGPAPSPVAAPPTGPTSGGSPTPPGTRLDDLYRLPMPKLFAYAEREGINEHTGMNRGQLIMGIVRRQIERGMTVRGSGTLEVLPDGYGFLRSVAHNYLASPEDIYVSPSQIRRLGLKTGLIVEGPIRLPVEGQDNFALMQVDQVNGSNPEQRVSPTTFEDLTPLHPNRRLILETSAEEINMRVVDLVTPIGKGQRGLIVSPPRAGKTILLQKIALSLLKNHPESYLIVLLVDERPEEVTDMARTVAGPMCEVVASTFDEPSSEHVHVSDIVLEKAKRLVEHGKDVIILLDSITRLARAHNTEAPSGGKLLSGGLDTNAMQRPKRFFGAARQTEEGGSLTILATALIDTGSRMDEVIFEEFKGTGNMELHLDRRLVDKRVWPAIDINRSGTRKEELLHHPQEVERIRILRRVLSDMHPVEAMEMLVTRLRKTKSNAEFLMSMNMS